MGGLQQRLRRQQKAFARKVRRFVVVGLAAGLCLVLAFFYMGRAPWGGSSRIQPDQEGNQQDAYGQPLALLPEGEPHPSQLIPASILYAEPHINPVRRVGPSGQTVSIVDKGMLFLVLQTVSELSQEELEARVDEAIVWEDFSDQHRREQIRGRICRFRGTLFRWEKREDSGVHEIGLEALYEGQILDGLGRWYSFYCFEEPPRLPGRPDVAELVGVFYKLIQYPTPQGEQMVTPLIVGRTITVKGTFSPPPRLAERILQSTPPWAFWSAVAVLAAVVFGGLSFLLRARRPRLRRRRKKAVPESPKSGTEQQTPP